MAKSKDTQAAAPAPASEATDAPVLEKNEQPGAENAPAEAPAPAPAEAPAPTPAEAPVPAPERLEEEPQEPEAPTLYSLEELAGAKRVPGWQSAALHKLMGWEPGKRVSEAEYTKALVCLKNRRIGG